MKNLLFALIALATVACSNDEPQKKGFETNEDIYNVTTSWEGVLDNTAHSLQLSFQATSSWEAAVQDEAKSWLSVTPTSGASGLNKVLVNVKSNPTTEDRAGSLSIIPLIGEPYVVTVSQKKMVIDPTFNPIVGTWERYYTDYHYDYGECHQVEVFTEDFKNTSRIYVDGILKVETFFSYTINQTNLWFIRDVNGDIFEYKYLIEGDGNTLRLYTKEPGSVSDEVYSRVNLK